VRPIKSEACLLNKYGHTIRGIGQRLGGIDGETVGAKMGTRSGGLRRRTRSDRGTLSIAGLFFQFAIAGLVVLVVLVALVGFTVRQAGVAQAIESARRATLAGPSIVALLALELALASLAWSLVRRNQRQQRELEQLRGLAAQACDQERRRLAGELHDGVLQELTAINYELEWLRLGGASPDQRDEVIAESASRLRGSIGSLRTLLVDIYPPNLAEKGLGSALAGLAEGLERAGMDVQLETAEAECLPPAATALIFRAAQEAVRNVATHSGAREVVITAGRRDGQATLVVDDDGQGFDEARLKERISNGHFGLRSMGDLMAASGGMLRVRATPGRGTKVMVKVPVG
jgi:two-component system NarL family sensor kinase